MPLPSVATALIRDDVPSPELAAEAVATALARTGGQTARGVLLFLTSDFSRIAQAAVLAASRAGTCLQVCGCTAPGIFTEEDWLLDRPGAAALVLTGSIAPVAPPAGNTQPMLTFADVNTLAPRRIDSAAPRWGALLSNTHSTHVQRCWSGGKVASGRVELVFGGADVSIGVSLGLRTLSSPQVVGAVRGYELQTLAGDTALASLQRHLPLELREPDEVPLHRLFAGVVEGAPATALQDCNYAVVPIIALNHDEGSITLGAELRPGSQVFWGMRSPVAAEQDMRVTLDRLSRRMPSQPQFGVVFSCLGRGPYFYGTGEADLAAIRGRFPRMPFIGTYTAGQIAACGSHTRSVHNAAVIGLVRKSHV